MTTTGPHDCLPHLKEILATAAAAGTAASHNVVGQLPDGAQEQVARYAPALAPKKKKGGFLIVVGAAALAGAGYLVYADQQKKKAKNAQLSEAAIADSKADRSDEMTINNPVTDFNKADDTTMVRPAGDGTAEPAGGPGTAATWTEAEESGHMSTEASRSASSSRRAPWRSTCNASSPSSIWTPTATSTVEWRRCSPSSARPDRGRRRFCAGPARLRPCRVGLAYPDCHERPLRLRRPLR